MLNKNNNNKKHFQTFLDFKILSKWFHLHKKKKTKHFFYRVKAQLIYFLTSLMILIRTQLLVEEVMSLKNRGARER